MEHTITEDKPLDAKTERQIIGLCQAYHLNVFMYLRVRLLYHVIPGDLRSYLTSAGEEKTSATNAGQNDRKMRHGTLKY